MRRLAAKTSVIFLVLLAFPSMIVGTVVGFIWEHFATGWWVGRASSDWLREKIPQHFPKDSA